MIFPQSFYFIAIYYTYYSVSCWWFSWDLDLIKIQSFPCVFCAYGPSSDQCRNLKMIFIWCLVLYHAINKLNVIFNIALKSVIHKIKTRFKNTKETEAVAYVGLKR